MNEPTVTVQLTQLDIEFLRTARRELEDWQFRNRGRNRTEEDQIYAEVELRFVDRLLKQIP